MILARFLFAPSLRIPVCFTRSVDFQTIPPLLGAAPMSEVVPTALILGHSFVKRLNFVRSLCYGADLNDVIHTYVPTAAQVAYEISA